MLKNTKGTVKKQGEESVEWVSKKYRGSERERLWGLKIFNEIIGKVFNVGRNSPEWI